MGAVGMNEPTEFEIAEATTAAPDSRGREARLLDELSDLIEDPEDAAEVRLLALRLARFYAGEAIRRQVVEPMTTSREAALVAWAKAKGLTDKTFSELAALNGLHPRTLRRQAEKWR